MRNIPSRLLKTRSPTSDYYPANRENLNSSGRSTIVQLYKMRMLVALHYLIVGLKYSPLVVAGSFPDPKVTLSYGTFQGAYNAEYNLSYFGRIPFAAPPIGENRFRGPQPVENITTGVYNSNRTFDMCPQRTVNGSEDCLYLGVASRPWKTGARLRPVLFNIYGGGFIQGAAGVSMPPSNFPVLNLTDDGYVTVYANHRVNAFGFLPGKKIKKSLTSDLNPGLLDQQAALLWVHNNIKAFGGDPSQVVIWGQSAGGGGVAAQVIANGGKTEPRLFARAVASSPFWPKSYNYDSEEAENLYQTLASLTGCSEPKTDSLACLKDVDAQKIRDANQYINTMHQYTTSSFTWAPVIDGSFLREPLSKATAAGRLNADMDLSMYNTFEGSNFVPAQLNNATGTFNSTSAGFQNWLEGFLPKASNATLDEIYTLYPAVSNSTTYSTVQERAGFIFRDLVLACPGYWLASATDKGYIGEFTILPAKHATDTVFWNSVSVNITAQPETYRGYAGAYAGFIIEGDPNLLEQDVEWPQISSGRKWIVASDGFSVTGIGSIKERCDFWRRAGREVDT